MGFILSLLSISFLLVTVSSFFALGYSPHLFFAYVVTTFFCIAVLPCAAKIAFLTPHYLPVRFNRKTQKNLFCRHKDRRWYIFPQDKINL